MCYIAAHTAVIFDCHTRAQLVLQGHRNPISSLVATEDRSLVVTADEGPDSSMIVVWNVTTGEPVRTIENPHATGVVAMDITPDGAYAVTVAGVDAFASADEAQEMCVWRLDDDDAFDDGNGDPALDLSASEDRPAPVLRGYAPDGDAQTCVRFHPYDWTEFATKRSSTGVFLVARRRGFGNPSAVQPSRVRARFQAVHRRLHAERVRGGSGGGRRSRDVRDWDARRGRRRVGFRGRPSRGLGAIRRVRDASRGQARHQNFARAPRRGDAPRRREGQRRGRGPDAPRHGWRRR